jgi:pseudouridine-5'-phosphate glycosidase
MILIKRSDGGVTIKKIVDGDVDKEIKKTKERLEKKGIKVIGHEEVEKLPQSRNYRDAWTHDLDIDLEKAKQIQKVLIEQKMYERTKTLHEREIVKNEILALDVDAAKNINQLYNIWPESIDMREKPRDYKL